jgi:hypothetical protein
MLRIILENNLGGKTTAGPAMSRRCSWRRSATNACSTTTSGRWQEKNPWSTTTSRGCSKRKDSNDVYITFALARKCDTALKEAQNWNGIFVTAARKRRVRSRIIIYIINPSERSD